MLDVNTIKSLCSEKFKPIIDRLKSERLTVEEVREEMSAINKSLRQPKQPVKAVEWKQTQRGDRFLNIRLEDPEAGMEFEQQLKQSQQPLPLFIRSLLRSEGSKIDIWQEAQEDVAVYIQEQSAETDEILELQRKIEECDRFLAKYPNPAFGTEALVVGVSKEEKFKYQQRLRQLGVAA